MTQTQILDADEAGEPKLLYSKASIVLVSAVLSLFWGAVFYCINLGKAGQTNKVVGTFAAILLCNVVASMPWFGIPLSSLSPPLFEFGLILPRALVALFIVFPMWNKHLGDQPCTTTFPIIPFLFAVGTSVIFPLQQYWMGSGQLVLPVWLLQILRFNYIGQFALLVLLVIIRLGWEAIKRVRALFSS